MKQVAVIGQAILEDSKIYELTVDIGRELAKNGIILICGGKGGAMEAACKGVHEKKGLSIGILPSIDPKEANEYVKVKIPTNLGENRNYIIIQSAEAVICIGGKTGTRMEAEYSLKLNKPLITIPKSGGVSKEFSEIHKDKVYIASDSNQVISIIKRILGIT